MYLCVQQLRKVRPDFDPVLAGILRRDPQGVVVLTEDRQSRFVGQRLRERFTRTLGDVAGRVPFLPYQARDDYLSLVASAEVVLDPLHYGGVTTTYDAFRSTDRL